MDIINKSIISTLVILIDGSKILLGFKKRGFGVGKWNGFGGKVQPGEDIKDCAARELEEECGLRSEDLIELGVLTFEILSNSVKYVVYLYITTKFQGTVTESEEMRPKWFDIDKIPFEQMWPDDKYWLPHAIAKKKFNAFFLYENEDKILKYTIEDLTPLQDQNGVV